MTMNIKLIILSILMVYYLLTDKNPKAKNRFIVLACALLTIESGLRGLEIGPDTHAYYSSFYVIMGTPWNEVFLSLFMPLSEVRDPGYDVIIKLFSTIIPSWQLYCLASAIFLYVSVGKLWAKYIETKQGVLFAVVLWLALFDIIALSGMRQMLTTAIAFYMIPFVEEKRWKIVIPTIALGSMIHVSLLFFIAFIPLSYAHSSHYKTILLLSIIMVPVIGTYSQQIMAFMANSMENDYYKGYIEEAEGPKAYVYVVLCTSLSLFILINYRYLKTAPVFFLTAAVLMTLFVPLILRGGTAIRIGQYFTVYMMLSLPWINDRSQNKSVLYLVMISVLLFSIVSIPSDYVFFWDSVASYTYGY